MCVRTPYDHSHLTMNGLFPLEVVLIVPLSDLHLVNFLFTVWWNTRLEALPTKTSQPGRPKISSIRADGSSFVHWTASPRSLIKLTREVTNNTTWNPGIWKSDGTEESTVNRKVGQV